MIQRLSRNLKMYPFCFRVTYNKAKSIDANFIKQYMEKDEENNAKEEDDLFDDEHKTHHGKFMTTREFWKMKHSEITARATPSILQEVRKEDKVDPVPPSPERKGMGTI